jgi:hypothetical protein
VLFGTNCGYYHSLQKIFAMLKLKEVYALKAKFTPENCHRITWAISYNGCTFFIDGKTNLLSRASKPFLAFNKNH